MGKTIQKYWIAAVGSTFVFLSLIYFIKLAYDRDWIPPIAMIIAGLLIGFSLLISGYSAYNSYSKKILAQALAGFGAAVIYATLVYAGLSEEIQWPANVLLICFVALTLLVSWFAYALEMRLLMNISMIGGLLVPVVIKASLEQVELLFIYVLFLNIATLILSVMKRWKELPVSSFVLTMIIYTTYYVHFEPEAWHKPFSYITTFFLIYAFGLIIASWKDEKNFEGFNLFLGVVNALNFVFWTYTIFKKFGISSSIPITFVGFVFLISSGIIYKLSKKSTLPILSYFFLGVLLIATAGPSMDFQLETVGLHFVIKAIVWLFLIALMYFVGHFMKSVGFVYISVVSYFLLFLYWFGVAWKVEWVEWFGLKFIPFINPGALVWIAMATLGFIMSWQQEGRSKSDAYKFPVFISILLGLFAHLLVGGLLTIQIQNTWDAFLLHFVKVSLAISIVWVLYAAGLFIWGAWTKGKVYRWVGSIVLIITSIKAVTSDLDGADTIYKAGFLFIMGILMLAIFYINEKWNDETQQKENAQAD